MRGRFTNLKETLATNLATNRGLDDVLAEIKHHIQRLPHVGSELPRTWVQVRRALEADPRNTIGVEEYLDICANNGFTALKDKLQLSGYLHDLGVCLHFQDDALLKRTVILKHALRNALVPIVTISALLFGELLAGAVLTEQIFTIPGFGKMIVDAVFNRDYAVVQGVVLCTAVAFIAMNLAADAAYRWLNPRMREQG